VVDHCLVQEDPADLRGHLMPKAIQAQGHSLIEAVECDRLLAAAVEEQEGRDLHGASCAFMATSCADNSPP
jgi:hypothetical protein